MATFDVIYGRPVAQLSRMEMFALCELSRRVIAHKADDSEKKYALDGRASGSDRVLRNVEGYAAEYAVCCYHGVPFKWSIYHHTGDKGIDLELRDGTKIGVKSSRYTTAHLLVKREELARDVVPDIYILARVDVRRGRVFLLGSAQRARLEFLPTIRQHPEGPDSVRLPQTALDPITITPRVGELLGGERQ